MPSPSGSPGSDPLFDLVAEVLGVPGAELTERTGPGVHDRWTSLKHIELVVAVEHHYDVALSSREIRGVTSIAGLRKLLEAKGAAGAAA